jgi:predicted dehydrogenase
MFEIETKSQIGFGVVGCGWVARDYAIPAIIESANARLVALCDLNCVNYEAIATNDKSVFRTTDLDEFLAAENLDAVYIATPNESHCFLTRKCAAAGKHVLCEKPMATSYADASLMTEVCESFGVAI